MHTSQIDIFVVLLMLTIISLIYFDLNDVSYFGSGPEIFNAYDKIDNNILEPIYNRVML